MNRSLFGNACLLCLVLLVGCNQTIKTDSSVEIRAANTREHSSWERVDFQVGGLDTWVAPEATVACSDILSARRSDDGFGHPTVILRFDQDASSRMDELSVSRMSHPVVIVLDGRIIAAPIIMERISDTLVVNFGKTPGARATADRLVDAVTEKSKKTDSEQVATRPSDESTD